MSRPIKVDQKKGRGRPATGRGTMVSSRIPSLIVADVDDWALQNDTTRSNAIRQLIEMGLSAGRNPSTPSERLAAARAQELAARTIGHLSEDLAGVVGNGKRKRRLIKGPDRPDK